MAPRCATISGQSYLRWLVDPHSNHALTMGRLLLPAADPCPSLIIGTAVPCKCVSHAKNYSSYPCSFSCLVLLIDLSPALLGTLPFGALLPILNCNNMTISICF